MTSLSSRRLSLRRRSGASSALRSWIRCPDRTVFLAGSAWSIGTSIKHDVLEAFHSLWNGDCRGLHAANQALVSLLPKHAEATKVKDFRPISLIHSVAKLVAKVLSSRLAPRMAEIVGPQKSAFIRGRCLHDKFQLVQLTARKLHALKREAVLLKLDITKAFGTVDWAFLLEVLAKLGFGHRWITMICGLLGTASTRVVVNDIAGGLIYNRRGLHQGDPLSPLLFDTVMDVLHLMFERAAADGLLSELAPSGFRHRTSMYADDVVTFIRPTKVELLACAYIVDDFGVASGLRTNLAKCSIHPIRCRPEQVELASRVLGCEVAAFPFKYLGLPLVLRKVTAAQMQPLVDGADNRLQPWVAFPKCFCGLCIPNLRLLNLALRCRWSWLQKVDTSKAWSEFNFQLPSLSIAILDSATCYKLSNGERARFWKDRWLNGDRVVDIAPNVVKMVSKRRANAARSRTA
ncbi:hypothetical protein ACQ4PT_068947 [Festuca glaucescens]